MLSPAELSHRADVAHRVQIQALLRAGHILIVCRDTALNGTAQRILEHALYHILLPEAPPCGPSAVPANTHPKVPYGLCPVCLHYGDDCKGRGKPPVDWQVKEG